MRDENVVRDLVVSDGPDRIRATYFIEQGILHASIEGRTFLLPVGSAPSDESLRQLLIGQLRMRAWRERMTRFWRRGDDQTGG